MTPTSYSLNNSVVSFIRELFGLYFCGSVSCFFSSKHKKGCWFEKLFQKMCNRKSKVARNVIIGSFLCAGWRVWCATLVWLICIANMGGNYSSGVLSYVVVWFHWNSSSGVCMKQCLKERYELHNHVFPVWIYGIIIYLLWTYLDSIFMKAETITSLIATLCLSCFLNHLLHLSIVLLSTSQLRMVWNSSISTFLPNSYMTRRVCIHFSNSKVFTTTREMNIFLGYSIALLVFGWFLLIIAYYTSS